MIESTDFLVPARVFCEINPKQSIKTSRNLAILGLANCESICPCRLAKSARGRIDGCTKIKDGLKSGTGVGADPREVEAVKKVVTARMEGVPRLTIAKSESGLSFSTEHKDDFAGVALIMEAVGTSALAVALW
jgi:hypothetical protein